MTIAAVLLAAPFGVLAVALALSLSGVALRTPILAVMAVRQGNMGAANVLDGLRVVGTLAVISGAILIMVRMLPLEGVIADALGLTLMGGVSAAALAAILRRPQASPST